jgi:hypothetical protein
MMLRQLGRWRKQQWLCRALARLAAALEGELLEVESFWDVSHEDQLAILVVGAVAIKQNISAVLAQNRLNLASARESQAGAIDDTQAQRAHPREPSSFTPGLIS